MLYSSQKAMRLLTSEERAIRIALLNKQLKAGYVARNRGRALSIRAGYADPQTLECTLLEDRVLQDMTLVCSDVGRLHFDVQTGPDEYHSKVHDLADLLYRG